jgi:hypothetical protein
LCGRLSGSTMRTGPSTGTALKTGHWSSAEGGAGAWGGTRRLSVDCRGVSKAAGVVGV